MLSVDVLTPILLNKRVETYCELEGVHKACPSFSCSEYRDYFEYNDMPN